MKSQDLRTQSYVTVIWIHIGTMSTVVWDRWLVLICVKKMSNHQFCGGKSIDDTACVTYLVRIWKPIVTWVNKIRSWKLNFLFFFVSAPCFGARHMFALMGFLGFVNVYAMRVNLSVAIVVMVNNTNNDNQGNGTSFNSNSTCPVPSGPNSTTPDKNQVGNS